MGKTKKLRLIQTLLLLIIFSSLSFGELIPNDRRIEWKNNVGVPNGIPTRTQIYATVDSSLYGAEQADVSGIINQMITLCPPNQVIFIPQGRYKISSTINIQFKSNITIRGAGPDKTILVSNLPANSRGISIGGNGYNTKLLTADIISGNTKGSKEITLSNVTGLQVGMMFCINQENDPDIVVDYQNRERMLNQSCMITGIQGNTVELDPPLVWTFNRNPQIKYFHSVCQFSGVEDFKIDHTNGNAAMGIFIDGSYGCWIKNVESYNANSFHFWGYASTRCELRNSFANDSKTTGPNHGGIIFSSRNTGWLVENNIFYKIFPGIEVSMSVGNAFTYNFATDVDAGSGFIGTDMDDNHGPHVMMNLWEGNSGTMFQSDGYFGSGSHGTLFRNHFRAEHPKFTTNRKAISLNRWSYYYNVVGNVLGTPSFPDTGHYDINVPYNYSTSVIYQLGYPNMGNNGFTGYRPPSTSDQALDLKVWQTVLRHGNFDYKTKSVIWNSDPQYPVLDQTLPNSLLYDVKPAWWPINVIWPPIGSDLNPIVSKIPAQLRYEGIEPTAPSFTSSEYASAQAGYPFIYKVQYDNPMGGTATISYTKKPSWAIASGDTVYGDIPKSATGTDTVIAILNVNGEQYDTLELKITITSLPVFTSPNSVTNAAGSAFEYKVKYVNPLAGTAAITYTQKPTWVTALGDTIFGTIPTSETGTDTIIAILDVDGVSYDTLTLLISIATTGLISSNDNIKAGFFVSANSINGRIKFDAGIDKTGTYKLEIYNIRGNRIWEYKNEGAEIGNYKIICGNAALPQGQYFVKLKQYNRQAINRFVIIK